jgi:hypothetical protein
LDDTKPEERRVGIEAGLAWQNVAHAIVVYQDYGISAGIRYGINLALKRGIPIVYRTIGKNIPE